MSTKARLTETFVVARNAPSPEQNLPVGSRVKRKAFLQPAFLLDPFVKENHHKSCIELAFQGMYITEGLFHGKGNLLFVLLFI